PRPGARPPPPPREPAGTARPAAEPDWRPAPPPGPVAPPTTHATASPHGHPRRTVIPTSPVRRL
ncbi:hypothetical protein F6X38_09635, partial [Aureimonas leprariae]